MCWTCWTAFSKSTRLYSNPSHNHFCYKNILQPFIKNMAQYGILIDLEPESTQPDLIPVPVQKSVKDKFRSFLNSGQKDFVPLSVQKSTQSDFGPLPRSTQSDFGPLHVWGSTQSDFGPLPRSTQSDFGPLHVRESTQNEFVPVRETSPLIDLETESFDNDFVPVTVRESTQNEFVPVPEWESAQNDFRSFLDTARNELVHSLDSTKNDFRSFLDSDQKDFRSFLDSAQKDFRSFLDTARSELVPSLDSTKNNLGLRSNLIEDDSCSALDLAMQKILNEKFPTFRTVATWACTRLKNTFQEKYWAITFKDHYTDNDPSTTNLTVEKVEEKKLNIHLAMELRPNFLYYNFTKILDQAVEKVQQTIPIKEKIFLVVQCGIRIGFFEYNNDHEKLIGDNIKNYHGCIPLTMDHVKDDKRLNVILDNKPKDLLPLEHRYRNKRGLAMGDYVGYYGGKSGHNFFVPCIFDLRKHGKEIDFLFHHMATEKPR